MQIATALNQFVSIYALYFKTGWIGVHLSEMTHVTMPDRIHSIQFFLYKIFREHWLQYRIIATLLYFPD